MYLPQHSTNISLWKKKPRSRAQYFIEYDAIPNRPAIKKASPSWTISRVSDSLLELFNRIPSSKALPVDSQHQGQKRSIQDMTREDYAQGPDNEPYDHRKKPRISGKENAFDFTAPCAISQFKGTPFAFNDGQNTSWQESCRTDPNSKPDSKGGATHLDRMALSAKSVCAPLTASLPSNVPAPTLSGSNLLPLGPKISVSAKSKAIVTSLLNAGAPLMEERLVPISTGEEVLNLNTVTSLRPQSSSMQTNECNGSKSKTPKKSTLSALQVAQNSLRKAEDALRAERENGKGLQEVIDGMQKRILKEVEARRAAEERLSRERTMWKRRGDDIIKMLLLDQATRAPEETVTVKPSSRTRKLSMQPTINCKQETTE